ncbi:TULIP family P47-like protein [Proteus sp. DFP240708]|uniref:TULIP family P47-like protein n=1 Tax=Proteus TaxID=583 RepID=UPI0018E43E5B|nr:MULTISPECIES: TULIP family P47-like protein [Proteus]MBI6217916.1 TULIP family P47-like protein [Proteus vulgaris]MBI6338204.1 TULIP family P47-like protein [Proteus sp. PR00224]MBI6406459.1 TULIP family P47-like protein [Proteus sp. PR00208]
MNNYRWDVIYACSGNYINKQLSNNKNQLIQSFEYEDSEIKITGIFDSWKIVSGGSGNLLQFETPIKTGVLFIKQFNETITLNNVIPLIEMQLKLIKGSDQTVLYKLVFNCLIEGKNKGDMTFGAVTVINPDVSGNLGKYLRSHPQEASLGAALLTIGLSRVFIQNAEQLNFVFANILPSPTGENANWLTPKKLTYAYQQPVSGALGGIAILGMLENVSITNLPRSFDTNLLFNKDFGFILSARAFLLNVVIPSLPLSFQGNSTFYDFRLENNVINLNNNFNLNAVKVDLIYYTPTVTDINFHIEDNKMWCYVSTHTNITGLTGAYIINTVTSINPSSFNVSTKTLSFNSDPNKSATKNEHIPCWEQGLGALTFGIMNIVIEAISLSIENSMGTLTSSKTAQSLRELAPGLVSWNGQQNMTIDAGGLADNVYMQGKLN